MQRRIYEYLDYREFLRDYYEFKKENFSGFSLRTFSNRIGFKTKDFILRVMKGDKNLSLTSVPLVAQGMGLNKKESDFFKALVEFNQAKDVTDRDQSYQHIQHLLSTVKFQGNQHLLAHYQYEVFSHWHHLTIRSLIGLNGFHGDYESLANRLHPKITTQEAKHSIHILESCGLIEKDPDLGYRLTHASITTGDRTSKAALRGFHQRCLQLASDSIERDHPQQRNISGLTLGISQVSYEKIVQRLNEFRKEIAIIAEEDTSADRVVQMNFQLFPLSRIIQK